MRRPGPGPVEPANVQPDGGLSSPAWQMAPTPAPLVSVPGLSEQDNVDTVGSAIVPPDTPGITFAAPIEKPKIDIFK